MERTKKFPEQYLAEKSEGKIYGGENKKFEY